MFLLEEKNALLRRVRESCPGRVCFRETPPDIGNTHAGSKGPVRWDFLRGCLGKGDQRGSPRFSGMGGRN